MKSFLIVGLGRFGSSIAKELCDLGNEVLAIDIRDERVQVIADQVTHAMMGDARDPEVLRSIGAGNFDCAVVAIGNDIGSSALMTMNLKELGVPRVVSKAHGEDHRKVLEKMGADLVVIPEQEMAERLAQNLSNTNIINFIELSSEYSIVERKVPQSWVGQSLIDLGVRAKFKLNVIAVRQPGEEMIVAPGGAYKLGADDTMMVLGRNTSIEHLDDK